ncbi:BatA domain-containing protein [uncultured Mesonia sp.]|uniref:BatA domain-containing protein n=1 Tax=uncultured Mesonia sp. TaxID=399731 RepID=UPI00374E3421
MAFKNIAVLYGLFLLLIPIFIHLFQFRKFKSIPFTNVAFLKKIELQSRKSSQLKKWLVLLSRLFMLSAIILAFAEPFIPAKTKKYEDQPLYVYLDNSLSMQQKHQGLSLFEQAKQELLQNLPKDKTFNLVTNNQTYANINLNEFQKELFDLEYSPFQPEFEEVYLKVESLQEDPKLPFTFLMLSDGLHSSNNSESFTGKTTDLHWVHYQAERLDNVKVDTAFVKQNSNETLNLWASFSANTTNDQPISVSVYDDNKLLGKSTLIFKDSLKQTLQFTINQNSIQQGRIEVDQNDLAYDNYLYFTKQKAQPINIVSINSVSDDFLKHIFLNDSEFSYHNFSLNAIDYKVLQEADLIALNEIKGIPTALSGHLKTHVNKEKQLIFILPDEPIDENLRQFTKAQGIRIKNLNQNELKIAKINYEHPLLKDVFKKKTTNFDYPKVSSYYSLAGIQDKIISFSTGEPFLVKKENVYAFAAAFNKENSNYKRSPLIVPSLYTIAKNSGAQEVLYHTTYTNQEIRLPYSLEKDQIVQLIHPQEKFIPRQRIFDDYLQISLNQEPYFAGFYKLLKGTDTLRRLAFNHPRTESKLTKSEYKTFETFKKHKSIADFTYLINKQSEEQKLWKWFIIFALLFLLIETLLLKRLK